MIGLRLYILTLLLVIGCHSLVVSQDAGTANNAAPAEIQLDPQLKLNREAIINKGSSEQMRIDAVMVMLVSDNPSARKILLDVLRERSNPAAQAAICKSLSLTRKKQHELLNKDDFVPGLMEVLTVGNTQLSKLAADSLLIYDFDRISEPLLKLANDVSLAPAARVNVIYALQLQPDKQAVLSLYALLDDPKQQISVAAEKALKTLGMPIDSDTASRERIIDEIRLKGTETFMRNWIGRKQEQIQQLESELAEMRKLYILALERIYETTGDNGKKGDFLVEQLSSSRVQVRLWALQKVYEWRIGKAVELPGQLEGVLLKLISDPDRDVRFKTAEILALMDKYQSADKLLTQIKVETDEQVKLELFGALGWACYYAYSSASAVNMPPEVRIQALKLSLGYLNDSNQATAQKGAEVLKKLLEQNGLSEEDVQQYLGSFVQRFTREKDNPDGKLRGELLNLMAGLCGQSVYKDKCAVLFKPMFEKSLRDETDLVRESAVQGLISIDKTKALTMLRQNFSNDSSARLRSKLIELAGEVGGPDDLGWLSEKLGNGEESDQAFKAILRIFNQANSDIVYRWVENLANRKGDNRPSNSQMISLLLVAQRKAQADKDQKMLIGIQQRLAGVFEANGSFEDAAKLYDSLVKSTDDPKQKRAYQDKLLGIYLRSGNIDQAKDMITIKLSLGDITADSVTAGQIIEFFKRVKNGSAETFLVSIESIKSEHQRPAWLKLVKSWRDKYGKKPEPMPEPKTSPATKPAPIPEKTAEATIKAETKDKTQ